MFSPSYSDNAKTAEPIEIPFGDGGGWLLWIQGTIRLLNDGQDQTNPFAAAISVQQRVLETHLFRVGRSKVKVASHKHIAGVGLCTRVNTGFF